MKYVRTADEGATRRKKRKKRLTVTSLVLIIIFAVLFTVYKIVITPSRVVQLSLLNTGLELVKSFEYVTGDESIGIIKDVLADGGTTDMTLMLEKSPVLSGVDADITCVNDGNKTISEIKFNSLVKFKTYTDEEEFLVNIPLLSYGLHVPIKNFSEEYDKSIFKNKITIDPNSEGNKAIAGIYAAIAAKGFYDTRKGELIDWITSIEFNKDKGTDVYKAELSSDKMNELKQLAADYFNATENSDNIKNMVNSKLESFVDDYTIEIKVRMYNIREINIISSDGTRRVIQLNGKLRPSYDITYYKEGWQDDALRRIHTNKGSGIDELLKGGKDIFVLNKDGGKMSVKTNYSGIDIDLSTDNMSVSGDTAKMENISLTLNDTVTVSGDISMSKTHDKSLTFEREESYINLLKIDESKWKFISDIVVGGIQLIKSKL